MAKKYWLSECWQIGCIGLVRWVGAIGIAVSQTFVSTDSAYAQSNIVPDNTLGAESSQVITIPPNILPIDVIDGGAIRGVNLFHSFQEFNVDNGRGVYFLSPNANIRNILARVTGRNSSEIFGTVGTSGGSQPNLFLINPNGIVFGRNSNLDVGGSFIATTANAVRLGETGLFSATQPASSNLLSIAPSALFYSAVSQQAQVINRSRATDTNKALGLSINGASNRSISGLNVLSGKSLLLVGGDVRSEGGFLEAPGGRVELGGLSSSGTVEIKNDSNVLSLDFSNDLPRSDVLITNRLTDRSAVFVTSDNRSGSITINARNINISGGSVFFAGTSGSLETANFQQLGDITLNATEAIRIGQESAILNNVFPDAIGNSGNININTGSLSIATGAQLQAITYGQGNTGNITINARDTVFIDGINSNNSVFRSGIISTVGEAGKGNSGDIRINVGSLSLNNAARIQAYTEGQGNAGNILIDARNNVFLSSGSQIQANTYGQGNAGNVIINASDTVSLDGKSTDGRLSSSIETVVEATGRGNGGDIRINTGSLFLSNEAQMQANTYGLGNAGNIIINARETFSFDGNNTVTLTQVQRTGKGKGGDIRITTGSLSFKNGAALAANTFGEGDAGNVIINARDTVFLRDGAQIQALTNGQGNAGNVIINAGNSVSLDGTRPESKFLTSIGTTVEQTGRGNGGDIRINTGSFSLTNGAQIQAGTNGTGNAGNIFINALDSVSFSGTTLDKELASAALSRIEESGTGKGGDISITTKNLSITNGAQLGTSTSGKGNAGSVSINASETVSFDGENTAISSGVQQTGKGEGGDIRIATSSLSITRGAGLSASTNGEGNAGTVTVNASDTVSLSGIAGITSEVEEKGTGQGGDIRITSKELLLTNGALLIASSSGKGDAGNVIINARDRVSLSDGDIFTTVETGGIGQGGNIQISTGGLSLINGSRLIAFTRGRGNAGNVILNAGNIVSIDGNNTGIASRVQQGAIGQGGDIRITTGSLSLTNNAALSASTSGRGDAGRVIIDAKERILFDTGDIFSRVEQTGNGKGGDMRISSNSLLLTNGAQLQASSNGQGDAGNIIIEARDYTILDSLNKETAIFSGIDDNGVGNGGDIQITTGSLSLSNGAQLSTNTRGKGNAGDVIVEARESISLNQSAAIFSNVRENGIGKGGDIRITTGLLSLISSQLVANTYGTGDAGSIIINAGGTSIDGKNSGIVTRVEETGIGNAGGIRITTDSLSIKNDAGGIFANTFGKGNAGNVMITARSNVSISGGGIFSGVGSSGNGIGGDVNVTTNSLSLTNGAQLSATTFGRGNAGNVTVDARDVSFDGKNNDGTSGASSAVLSGAIGNAGQVRITTSSLSITNEAGISNSTFGQGNAGNVIIDAKERVILGKGNLFSTVEETGIGKGGDFRITTNLLSLTNDAQLSTSTFGQGNAGSVSIDAKERVSLDGSSISTRVAEGIGRGGDIRISTNFLSVTNEALISSSTFGRGDAGNIQIKSNSVFINGASEVFSSTAPNSIGKGGDITVDTKTFSLSDDSALDARTRNASKGGNITLNTHLFEAFNGGQLLTITSNSGQAGKITVNATDRVFIDGGVANSNLNSGFFVFSESTGSTGDIEVNSPKITLDNGGKFIADSALGNGGNIKLQVSDLLLLRRGGQISTNAGTEKQGGDGGNININSKYIIAVPEENSDITANAYSGTGGQVQINSQGIFGIDVRSRPTNRSDITASSELGIAGVTNINSPDTSSLRNSLNQLPENIIDTNALLANSCITRRNNDQSGTFFITGSGGLPERPGDAPLSPYLTGTIKSVPISESSPTPTTFVNSWKIGDPIVEPQGAYQLANGQLVLSRECP